MQRELFIVHAEVIDANGTYNALSGYPKTFDSRSYDNDIEKAYQRARGEWHNVLAAMSKADTRQLQTAYLMDAYGNVKERESMGRIADLPDGEN